MSLSDDESRLRALSATLLCRKTGVNLWIKAILVRYSIVPAFFSRSLSYTSLHRLDIVSKVDNLPPCSTSAVIYAVAERGRPPPQVTNMCQAHIPRLEDISCGL